jgi:hypothetical protein
MTNSKPLLSVSAAEAPLQRQIGMTLANLLPVVFQLVAGACLCASCLCVCVRMRSF